MFEKLYLKIRNEYRKISIKIKNKWAKDYVKLPKDVHYFEGSLYDAVLETSLKYPENTAIQYEDNQITYKQLISKINKYAKSLKMLNVQKGDKVTICMPNTPEEVAMFYAINEVGAVANMIHPLSSPKEIEYYLNKSESKIMLCIDIAFKNVQEIMKNTKLEHVIVCNATKSMTRLVALLYWLTKGRKIAIEENKRVMKIDHFVRLGYNYEGEPYTSVEKEDPAVILYSGGTTGKPKGVVISNYSFNAQALQSKYVSEVLNPECSFLTFLPNFHAFGIGICTHTPLYTGGKAILIPNFNGKKMKSYIRKYRFNVLCGVPTLYDSMTKTKFKKNELKCLKLVVCGGDSMSLELKQKVNKFLNDYGCKTDIRVGYGLTESSGVVALSPNGINEADVIGYPFPDAKFMIMNINTNKEANVGDDGEICISGPNLMVEYLNDKTETEDSFFEYKGEKWLHTGDIGFLDKDGLVHYKSRLKRMIITSGYNVYPSQVEEVLLKHEAVENCAVIGIPDKNKGEIVKAFIVLKEGKDGMLVKNSIQKHLKEHLARYENPREIRYIDELPKTKLGKIAYKELEKMK